MKQSQITYWCHSIIKSQIPEGGVYVDATMGNGHDTLFLCEMAGENGSVWAFDIQNQALESTRTLLSQLYFFCHKKFKTLLDFQKLLST